MVVCVCDGGGGVHDQVAEKYYQQTRDLKKRNSELEKQVLELTEENGTLTTKLSRSEYISEQLATEVAERNGDKFEQLQQDYMDVEAELDEGALSLSLFGALHRVTVYIYIECVCAQ